MTHADEAEHALSDAVRKDNCVTTAFLVMDRS